MSRFISISVFQKYTIAVRFPISFQSSIFLPKCDRLLNLGSTALFDFVIFFSRNEFLPSVNSWNYLDWNLSFSTLDFRFFSLYKFAQTWNAPGSDNRIGKPENRVFPFSLIVFICFLSSFPSLTKDSIPSTAADSNSHMQPLSSPVAAMEWVNLIGSTHA